MDRTIHILNQLAGLDPDFTISADEGFDHVIKVKNIKYYISGVFTEENLFDALVYFTAHMLKGALEEK